MNTPVKILLPALLLCCASANAQTAPALTRTIAPGYTPGATFDVRLDFANPGFQPMNALYIVENLPAGWTLVAGSVTQNSGRANNTDVVIGTDATKLEMLWLEMPTKTNAFFITYRVNVPSNAAGVKTFSGEMDWVWFDDIPTTVATLGDAGVYSNTQVGFDPYDPVRFDFENSLLVTLTNCAGFAIYYTLDGSEPAKIPAHLYAGPFPVTQTCTVKARAENSGTLYEVYSASYRQAIKSEETTPTVGVGMNKILATVPNVPGGVYSLVKTKASPALPAGLKIAFRDPKAGDYTVVLSGAPTKASAAPLTVTYEVLVKVGAVTTVLTTIDILFEPVLLFPKPAIATYNGWVRIDGGPNDGLGVLTLTVSARGAISGKIVLNGVSRAFTATTFINRDGSLLPAKIIIKSGRNTWAELGLALDADTGAVIAATLEGGDVPLADISLFRNAWSAPGMPEFFTANFNGYYTAQLPSSGVATPDEAPQGTGYITFTLSAKGAARWAGKLADGTAFTGSGVLLLDGDITTGRYYLPVAANYNSKKADFAALVEFIRNGAAKDNTLVSSDKFDGFWRNTDFKSVYTEGLDLANPPMFGFGFKNSVRVAGGFYNKLEDFAAYYLDKNKTLWLDNDPVPNQFAETDPALDGKFGPLELVTSTAAGLSFTVKNDLKFVNGEWDYNNALNPLGLTFKFTKATGLFTGKFNVYYDYYAPATPTKLTHALKAVSYAGILTPWRDAADAALPEGAGYFLLNLGEKCWYKDANGLLKNYLFTKWSYGFWIDAK